MQNVAPPAVPPAGLSLAELDDLKAGLLERSRIYCWKDIAADAANPPRKPGVYAWFFQTVPPGVPVEGCPRRAGLTLLYVGISPASATSRETLRSRIRYHFRGNAEGSTFRLTLGCLLAGHSGSRFGELGQERG